MSFEDAGIQKIKKELEENGPQLLSTLGELLESEDRPHGKLKEALVEAGVNMARKGARAKIYAYLDGQIELLEECCKNEVSKKYPNYIKSVVIAFRKKLQPGEMIGLELRPKTQYHIIKAESQFPPGVIAIEEKYRHPHSNVSEIDNELVNGISSWARSHGVDKSLLVYDALSSCILDRENFSAKNIFKRFMLAQPPEIRDRINIPAFIINLFHELESRNGRRG